jgi:UDP-glucose 4-epimerase
MKKVLVTGGAGFIGSNLIKRLVRDGYEVHSLDNYSVGKTKPIEGVRDFKGDIQHIDTMDKDFDIIFHLAAMSRIQPSFQNPSETFETNVEGTKKVIEFATKIGARLIYASSSSIHSGELGSPYTMSKMMGEQWGWIYSMYYNLDFRVARLYNVYGEGELVDSPMAAIIGLFRRAVKDGTPIQIHGDGRQRRDFTHIVDIVDGLMKVAENKNKHTSYNIWELGTGAHYSINDVYDMFKKKFPQLEKIYVGDVRGNYRDSLRRNDLALSELGWKPEDRLKKYINIL